MSNRIRYALGQSAHGDFVAAMSDGGLVAFELVAGADNWRATRDGSALGARCAGRGAALRGNHVRCYT